MLHLPIKHHASMKLQCCKHPSMSTYCKFQSGVWYILKYTCVFLWHVSLSRVHITNIAGHQSRKVEAEEVLSSASVSRLRLHHLLTPQYFLQQNDFHWCSFSCKKTLMGFIYHFQTGCPKMYSFVFWDTLCCIMVLRWSCFKSFYVFRLYQWDVMCVPWQYHVRRPMRVILLVNLTRRELLRQRRCNSWERRSMLTLREPWTVYQVDPSLVTHCRVGPMVTSTVLCVMSPWTVELRLRVISWESNTRQRWTGWSLII